MMISTNFGVHINPDCVASMEWIEASEPKPTGFRALKITMNNGQVFHVEAAPQNCGADELELAVLKSHMRMVSA